MSSFLQEINAYTNKEFLHYVTIKNYTSISNIICSITLTISSDCGELLITLGHFPTALIIQGQVPEIQRQPPMTQSSLKLFKLANSKSAFTLPTSCKNHSKGSCSQFSLLSLGLLTITHDLKIHSPLPPPQHPIAWHAPFSWDL